MDAKIEATRSANVASRIVAYNFIIVFNDALTIEDNVQSERLVLVVT